MVAFLQIMSTKLSAPGNRLQEIRENVLGWTQGRLADAVKDQGNQLSVRTISRLERGTNFYARTTFTRVHSAISEGLAKSGKQSMSLEAIFPQLLSPSVARYAKKPSSAVPIIKTIESNS